MLVVAGAGSGKTRVLTSRIAHLILTGEARPYSVLAITFTNKAAGEMKERLAGMLGPGVERMWVSTFHSACVRILRVHAERLGYSRSFTIYDAADSKRLVERVEKALNIDTKKIRAQTVAAEISRAKAELVDFESYSDRAQGPFQQTVARVYADYQKRLASSSSMDFDDLLMVTANLFEACPDVLVTYQERLQHVLVDEYQDTNFAQNKLVLMLGEKHRNVCVVGDADQSIYAFRGADVRNILQFEEAFPDATKIALEQNYRSTKVILDAANAVIANNLSRIPKDLWTEGSAGDPIMRYRAADENVEAAYVATEARRLAAEEGLFYNDIAVFYRANAQSRALEEAFSLADVPYKVVGAIRFYERKEVKDLLAYLKVVANPADDVSARRIVNVPRRGIGDTSLEKLARWAAISGRALGAAITDLAGAPSEDGADDLQAAGITKKAASGLAELAGLLADLRHMDQEGFSPGKLLSEVLDRTGYRKELEDAQRDEAEARLENVAELVGVAERFSSLDDMLSSVALVSDSDDLAQIEGKVSFMTLHVAKGLEFEAVFMIGMDDGVFPHMRSLDDPRELEEERRLCYVGMTRAKSRLYMTHALERRVWGSETYSIPSRFLSEIPEELVEDCRGYTRRGGEGYRR